MSTGQTPPPSHLPQSCAPIVLLPTLCPHAPTAVPPYTHTLQALAQRSDHLAVIAAFNAWTAARAAGGRGAAADFARTHFMNDQVGCTGLAQPQRLCVAPGGGGGLQTICTQHSLLQDSLGPVHTRGWCLL